MDSKWIEGTLRDFDSAAGDCGDYDEVVPIIAQYAKLIAQAHEAEVAQLKAQVAMMARALGEVEYVPSEVDGSLCCPWCGQEDFWDPPHTDECLREQALSAAPKVAWSGPVEVRLDAQGLPILVPLDAMQTLEQMDGQEQHVLVLVGEQGQENEQTGGKDERED